MSDRKTQRREEVTLAGEIVHRGERKRPGDKVTLRRDQIERLSDLGIIGGAGKTTQKQEDE